MKREELIKLLIILKEQARSSGVNTFMWDINIDSFNLVIDSAIQALEEDPTLGKIRADITKFAGTIQFNIGEVKAKYRNIGQHDGLEQALEIIDGNIKGDFDIDKWMAESEE